MYMSTRYVMICDANAEPLQCIYEGGASTVIFSGYYLITCFIGVATACVLSQEIRNLEYQGTRTRRESPRTQSRHADGFVGNCSPRV